MIVSGIRALVRHRLGDLDGAAEELKEWRRALGGVATFDQGTLTFFGNNSSTFLHGLVAPDEALVNLPSAEELTAASPRQASSVMGMG